MQNSETGYICAKYVEVEAEPLAAGTDANVVCRKLNVRQGAGTRYAKVGSLSRGEEVRVVGINEGRDWAKIEWQNDYAWVCAKYIERID